MHSKRLVVSGEETPTPLMSNRASPEDVPPPLLLDSDGAEDKSNGLPKSGPAHSVEAEFSSPAAAPIEMKRKLQKDLPLSSLALWDRSPANSENRISRRPRPASSRGVSQSDPQGVALSEYYSMSLNTPIGEFSEASFWTSMFFQIVPCSLACDILKTTVPWKLLQRFVIQVWQRSLARVHSDRISLTLHSTMPSKSKPQRPRALYSNEANSRRGSVQGIPNHGETCFMNSVLQSLASLEPFLIYLDRLHQVQRDQTILSHDECQDDTVANQLLELLLRVNGIQQNAVATGHNQVRVDPRPLLQRIGETHVQFRRRGEQQDAEEFLQALVGVVITEARLDSTTAVSDYMRFTNEIVEEPLTPASLKVTRRSEANMAPTGESSDADKALSLSGFLELMDEEQRHLRERRSSPSISQGECSPQASLAELEEKKQEDFEMVSRLPSSFSEGCTQRQFPSSIQIPSSAAVKIVQSTISSSTPSPLSGWLGSTVQCCKCQHVKPIRNSPFLDIPLVPTSVPSFLNTMQKNCPSPRNPNLRPCSVEECLADFTAVERVQDVECQNCTIVSELTELQEEEMLLSGALESTKKRIRAKGGNCELETKSLREDLQKVQRRAAKLKNMDPDDEDSADHPTDTANDESLLCGESRDRRKAVDRGYAKKCLFLTRCPSILCLHIQRRYYDPYIDRMEKCAQVVKFEEYLDLSPYCAYGSGVNSSIAGSNNPRLQHFRRKHQEILYRLTSVIEHRGNAFAGHYICYRRFGASWFRCSDNRISPIPWSAVKKCQAYMLFYEAE